MVILIVCASEQCQKFTNRCYSPLTPTAATANANATPTARVQSEIQTAG